MTNIRINTTPGGDDKFLNVQLDQKFDFVEILSLKISQEEVYRKFCSDYGVVVGRVTINNGFGVPNAKVSIFIPVDDLDKEDSEIFGLYPYERVNVKNYESIRYNLLPKKNQTKNECFTPIGSFFQKREVLDNDDALYIYCKYYKFTTTTNSAGDFMLFGVPVGPHQLHVDADLSDIGIASQLPYDLIRDGSSEKLFESPGKFKESKNLETLVQLKSKSPISVNVQPFWGDLEQCQIGITRQDVDLATNITPSAIFIGSLFSDSGKGFLNKQCKPRVKMGNMEQLVTGPGLVEMIRKLDDGSTERYDVNGGLVIDEDGSWAYQVPMNLDYITTDEYGNIVPTDDPNKGLPTRARVRFRVGMLSINNEGKSNTTAKYLIPHNPDNILDVDFEFGDKTKDESFYDLYWNKIYTVANHIPGYRPDSDDNENFIGIKDIENTKNNLFPFNKLDVNPVNPGIILLAILCVIFAIFLLLLTIVNALIAAVNLVIKGINGIIQAINKLPGIDIGLLNYIKYATLECNNQQYCIGCLPGPGIAVTQSQTSNLVSGADAGNKWLDCTTTKLAIGFNIIKFNFYNDWINGTLYTFLFRAKIRRDGTGREIFCEWNCSSNGVDNDNNGIPDNICNKGLLFDKCLLELKREFSPVNQGLIHKNIEEGVYYYAPITKPTQYQTNNGLMTNVPSFKLFATKIINLGSIFECDWQGIPIFYKYLVNTTYNMPEPAPIYHTSGPYSGQISENGIDSVGSNSLIAEISCTGVDEDFRQCNNTKRLCELGMGLDEDRRDPSTGSGQGVDNMINNYDVENPFSRGLFTFLNYPTNLTPLPSVPIVYIDSTNVNMDYSDKYYADFRGYNLINKEVPTFYQFNNSYYFYFGLTPGATALDKLYKNYLTSCIEKKKNELTIIIDKVVNSNTSGQPIGEITFHVIGGTPPYTYQWLGPKYGNYQYKCPDPANGLNSINCGDQNGYEFTLKNLLSGQYTVVVNDSNGNQTKTTVNITGLNSVSCEVSTKPTNALGNGKAYIYINGGSAPYNITIRGITDSSYFKTITTSQQTYCYGNCNGPNDTPASINSLPVGKYVVTVYDSGVPVTVNNQQIIVNTQCSKTILITQPTAINLSVNISDALCYNDFGSGEVKITGGVPPYTVQWVLTATNNPNNQNLINSVISTDIQPNGTLPAGTYDVLVQDLGGNIATSSTVVNEPIGTVVNLTANPPGCYNSETGLILINLSGPNQPYDIQVEGLSTSTSSNNNNGLIKIDKLYPSSTPYKVSIIDSNYCEISKEIIVPFPQYGVFEVSAKHKKWDVPGTYDGDVRIAIRFKGGNGGPYHFYVENKGWVSLGDPYNVTTPLPTVDYDTTVYTDYELYKPINGNPDEFEFQFWIRDTRTGPVLDNKLPINMPYKLSEKGQQGIYALFNGLLIVNQLGDNSGSIDSVKGITNGYGCSSYDNTNNIPFDGISIKGTKIS